MPASPHHPAATHGHPTRLLALVLLAVSLAAGCTASRQPQPGPTTATGPPASLSAARRQLQAGQLGTLPPPPQAPARGPRLTVPAGIVPVPGRYPLGTLVRFHSRSATTATPS